MAKYTKGEWSIERGSDGLLIYTDPFNGEEDKEIALVYDLMSFVSDEDEGEANANLIAAAPAMYEALKACFEMNGCHNDEESKLFDLTRNALSKAEGR